MKSPAFLFALLLAGAAVAVECPSNSPEWSEVAFVGDAAAQRASDAFGTKDVRRCVAAFPGESGLSISNRVANHLFRSLGAAVAVVALEPKAEVPADEAIAHCRGLVAAMRKLKLTTHVAVLPLPMSDSRAATVNAALRTGYAADLRVSVLEGIAGLQPLLTRHLGKVPGAPMPTAGYVPFKPGEVKVGGEIGHAIDLATMKTLEHLDLDHDFVRHFKRRLSPKGKIGDVERAGGPNGAFVGYGMVLDALVKAAAHGIGGERMLSLKRSRIAELIATQGADGSISIFTEVPKGRRSWPEAVFWDFHETSYLLQALVRDYECFGEKASLAAARRLADHAIERESPLTIGSEPGFLALYRATGDRKYRDCVEGPFAIHEPIGASSETISCNGMQHVYTALARALGQLDYAATTGSREPILFDQAHQLLARLAGPFSSVSGTCTAGEPGSHWAELWRTYQRGLGPWGETCASCYAMRLANTMLAFDPNPVYGDLYERILYNAFMGAQSSDGLKIHYFNPFQQSWEYNPRDTYCCPNNFRRMVNELPDAVFLRTPKGVAVNLYSDSTLTTKGLRLEVKTRYPLAGEIAISYAADAAFELSLRIPRWCPDARVTANGAEDAAACGSWHVVSCPKGKGAVTLTLPIRERFVAGFEAQAGKAARLRGPVVYGFDKEGRVVRFSDETRETTYFTPPAGAKLVEDELYSPRAKPIAVEDPRLNALLRKAEAAGCEVTATVATAGCIRVDYVLRPTVESYIRCQLALPVDRPWSGRFWGFGNGGPGGRVSVPVWVAARGDVAVHTDMGTSKGVYGKPEVLRDFGWRATHLMTVSGKALAAAFFGRQPTKSYFQGGSTGGGQGFHEALRFPEDYDGILSIVPANTRLPLHVYFAWNLRLMTDENGRRIFTPEELAAVEQAAIDWYADKDVPSARGKYLTDTWYSATVETNVLALAKAKCPSLAEGDKLARLHKMFTGPVLEGRQVHAGVPFSASLTGAAGNQWMLGWFLGPKRALHTVTDEELVRWMKEWGPDCDACGEGFARFAARGGKLIVVGGLEDSIVPYPSMVDWYERASVECGGRGELEKACRLYLLPGRAHGPGRGCGDLADGQGLITRWVEKGEAPNAVAAKLKGGGELVVRPYRARTKSESAGSGLLRDYKGGVPKTWEVADADISNSYGRVVGVKPIWIEGETWQGKPTRVFAWWGLPKGASPEKKVPAMVLVHGGGGTAFAAWVKTWNDRGYAAIAMDTCGGAPRGERDGKPHPRHPWSGPYGWGDPRGYPDGPLTDQWPYQAVTAIVRCHTFLRSLPEVDAERTGLTGISWGGYLTSITMGVDHRFKFAAPVYGCGWYDLNSPLWQDVAGGGDRFLRWVENWDPKHFIGDTRCPVLRCNGDLDKFYTMEMTRLSTEALPKSTPSHLSIKHKMPHGHPPAGDPKEITAWADHYLKGAPRPLRILDAKLAEGRLSARIDPGADEAVSAELLYETEVCPRQPNVKPWNIPDDWTIVQLKDFTRGATTLSVDVPPVARIIYANVTTAAGLVFSTPIFERIESASRCISADKPLGDVYVFNKMNK